MGSSTPVYIYANYLGNLRPMLPLRLSGSDRKRELAGIPPGSARSARDFSQDIRSSPSNHARISVAGSADSGRGLQSVSAFARGNRGSSNIFS